MDIETITLDEWSDALPKSGFEVFHTPAALSVLDRHTDSELHLFGGYKGEQPVGLFPAFVQDRPVGRTIFSPPPGMFVPSLGPVVMPTSPKCRKRERVNRRFTEGVLDALSVDGSLTVFRTICPPTYADPRPYAWYGLQLSPEFTYRIDLEGNSRDEILEAFSSTTRYEIRQGDELDVEIADEGVDGARLVYDDVATRYNEQGEPFTMSWSFVRDLVTELDDRARVYVARDADGTYLTGIIALYSNDAAYNWQGGVGATHGGVSVTNLLHWRIITDAIAGEPFDSLQCYDLVGANTERLSNYKSQFGGDLVDYYVAESSGASMDLAKRAYGVIKG